MESIDLEKVRTQLIAHRAAYRQEGNEVGAAHCDAALAAVGAALATGQDEASLGRVLDGAAQALEALVGQGVLEGAELVVLALVRVLIARGQGADARASLRRFSGWARPGAIGVVLAALERDATRPGDHPRARESGRAALELAMASRAFRAAVRIVGALADLHEAAAEYGEALLCRHQAWRLASRLDGTSEADVARRALAATLRRVARAELDVALLARLARLLVDHSEDAFGVELFLRAARLALKHDANAEALALAREVAPALARIRDDGVLADFLELEVLAHRKLGDDVMARSCSGRLSLLRLS